MGQPASEFARKTLLSGESILTVSAIKCTPHMIKESQSYFAAAVLKAYESPVSSAISTISFAWYECASITAFFSFFNFSISSCIFFIIIPSGIIIVY